MALGFGDEFTHGFVAGDVVAGETVSDLADGLMETVPQSAIFGLANGGDLSSAARASIRISGLVIKQGLLAGADLLEGVQTGLELAKEEVQLSTDIKLEVADQRFEVLQ